MAELEHVVHPVEPVYDGDSKVLILGTMASPASRKMGFFYGHPQNRFWKVMRELFGAEPGDTAASRRAFALEHGFALADVISECDIEGASDSSIKDPVPMDLSPIFETADIEAVFTTGGKASQLYRKLQAPIHPDVPHVSLPSTSGANARMRLPELVDRYTAILDAMGEQRPKPYFVYIARCADDTLYTGITDDVEKRMAAHNSGRGAKYTRGRLPVECIYIEGASNKSEALKRELEIKSMGRAQKEELIAARSL